MTLFLDSSPLSLLTNPRHTAAVAACNQWLDLMLEHRYEIVVPEIIDYELRRELVRLNQLKSLRRLDFLSLKLSYLPITTEAMRLAAVLWAQSRNQGQPTAPVEKLDVDVILAAQAITARRANTIVATSNVGHLSRFVTAAEWQTITL